MSGVEKPKQPPRQLNSDMTVVMARYMSRLHTLVYRATGGRLGANLRLGAGRKAPAPTLLLEHRGRKSGKQFTSPLIYMKDGDDLVVVASAIGRDDNPQWYNNVMASPDLHVTVGSERRSVTAVHASAEEKRRLWPLLVEVYADFATYQTWTTRELPVVVLKPRRT